VFWLIDLIFIYLFIY